MFEPDCRLRVLVLGGGGFFGRYIVAELNTRGHEVFITCRDSAALNRSPAQVIIGDFSQADFIASVMDQVQPELIINCAAAGVVPSRADSDAMCYLSNVQCVADVLNEAELRKVSRVVQIGSCFEYGSQLEPLKESDAIAPKGAYSLTKAMGSTLVNELGPRLEVDTLVIKLFSIWGAGEHPDRLPYQILSSLSQNQPLNMSSGEQLRDYLYAADAAEMVVALALKSGRYAGRNINLGSGHGIRIKDFSLKFARYLNQPERLLFGQQTLRADEQANFVADIQYLQEVLGEVIDRRELFGQRVAQYLSYVRNNEGWDV